MPPMGQQDVPDEVMLQQAGESARRLLDHLSRHAAGRLDEGTEPGIAAAVPVGELDSAVTSLRRLIMALHKESQRR